MPPAGTSTVTARVRFRRPLGDKIYLDCTAATRAGETPFLMEARVPLGTPGFSTDPSTVKLGDVVEFLCDGGTPFAGAEQGSGPPAGKKRLSALRDFTVTEPWKQLVSTGVVSWHTPVAAAGRPAAIIQCGSSFRERVAEYFGGQVAANYNKERHVLVYDSAEAPNHRWRQLLDAVRRPGLNGSAPTAEPRPDLKPALPPGWSPPVGCEAGLRGSSGGNGGGIPVFLRGVVDRVFLVTHEPCVSFTHALDGVRRHRREAGANGELAAQLRRDPARLKRITAYPRDVEKRLSEALSADVPHFSSPANGCGGNPAANAAVTATAPGQGPASPMADEQTTGSEHNTAEGKDSSNAPGQGEVPAMAGEQMNGSVQSGATRQPLVYDQVCYANGLYWMGLGVPRVLVPGQKADAPSAAYWKLFEINARYLSARGLQRTYTDRGVAFDIGASPGGWSFCCADSFGTRAVYAVDPAETMHGLLTPYLMAAESLEQYLTRASGSERSTGQQPLEGTEGSTRQQQLGSTEGSTGQQQLEGTVAGQGSGHGACSTKAASQNHAERAKPAIVHVRQKGQEFISAAIRQRVKPALYVCDMNAELSDTVSLVNQVHEADLFDKPALVVLTFKNRYRSQAKFAEKKAEGLSVLLPWLSDVEELHLFANTSLETTIVGQVL
ncbi:hypothetical protein DIPPA_21556 [Diplonema papillatum]|nr:hypothetical protein DIPPA_21556 [Diplonema papillatum]